MALLEEALGPAPVVLLNGTSRSEHRPGHSNLTVKLTCSAHTISILGTADPFSAGLGNDTGISIRASTLGRCGGRTAFESWFGVFE